MFLLFDIGGTNTRVAVSEDLKTLGESMVFSTPQDFEEGIERVASHAAKLTSRYADSPITGFAGCAPGPMDRGRTMLINAPNLPLWNNKPLVGALKQKLGCQEGVLENDAAVVGLGETHFGAAKGKKIVMYITVSTGVGGARIVDGKIDAFASGFEPGHQIIAPEFLSYDHQIYSEGYLEDFIGGHNLQKRFGKLPTEIKDEKVWEECALALAYGLHNSIVHWSPEIVVLGGSLITKPHAIPFERVQFHLNRIMKIFPAPPLVKSELGDMAGLYGAMVLAREGYGPSTS